MTSNGKSRELTQFSDTWDDFDSRQRSLAEGNKQFWREVDKGFADFDDLVKAEHAKIDREMSAKMTKVPTLQTESRDQEKRLARRRRSKSRGSSSDEEVNVNAKGDFELRINSFQCRPEDLKVKVSGNMVTVEGKSRGGQDRDDDSFTSTSKISSSFSRSCTIPADCDPDTVRADFDQRTGDLVVTAARKAIR